METLQKIALVITIIGALIWGIVGLFSYNILEDFVTNTFVLNTIYIIVGIAGLINIGILFRHIEEKK